jgi:hypothetical protein
VPEAEREHKQLNWALLLTLFALLLLLTRYVLGPANDVLPPGEYRDAGLAALFNAERIGADDGAGTLFQPDLRWYCATDALLLITFATLFWGVMRRVGLDKAAILAPMAALAGVAADLLVFLVAHREIAPLFAISLFARVRYLLFGLIWLWLGHALMLRSFPSEPARIRVNRQTLVSGIAILTIMLVVAYFIDGQVWNFVAFVGPMAFVLKIVWDLLRYGEFSDGLSAFRAACGAAYIFAGVITLFGAIFAPSRIEQASAPLVIALCLQAVWFYNQIRTAALEAAKPPSPSAA